jgi:hypothetical protein
MTSPNRPLAFLFCLLTFGANAKAGEVVSNYAQDMSRYPARVLALHFAKGSIDGSHTLTWGWWSVRFGEPTPVATPFKGQGPIESFEIPLQCQNDEMGTRDCTIEIVETRWNIPVCRITDGERIDMNVDCPASIEFAH